MRLIVLTPPYAGMLGAKGALGTPEIAAQHLGIPLISAGNLLREHDCTIGESIKAHLANHALVPDSEAVDMVLQRLTKRDTAAGFVLHNFPRTVPQATLLDHALADRDWAVDAVLQIAFADADVERQFASEATFSRDRLRESALAAAALRGHYGIQWMAVEGTYDPELMDSGSSACAQLTGGWSRRNPKARVMPGDGSTSPSPLMSASPQTTAGQQRTATATFDRFGLC